MGSDKDGFPIEQERDGDGIWHISGSLVAAHEAETQKAPAAAVPLGKGLQQRDPGMRSATWPIHLLQMLR